MSNGLSDHELLMEVREDVGWIKDHLGGVPTRREIYGVFATITTIGIAAIAALA